MRNVINRTLAAKNLLIAMVAFAFMACNENGASKPANDREAIQTVVAQSSSLIGQSPEKIDKAMQKAGFTKVEDSSAKVAKHAQQLKDEEIEPVEVTYIYNMPANYNEMTDDEYIKGLLQKGECYVAVFAIYIDDKLGVLTTFCRTSIEPDINLLYTVNSDELFKQLPKPSVNDSLTIVEWQGSIDYSDNKYDDHAQYVAALAAAGDCVAIETGAAVKVLDLLTSEGEGYGYFCYWDNPNEKKQADQQKRDGYTSVAGQFSVYDIAYQYLLNR